MIKTYCDICGKEFGKGEGLDADFPPYGKTMKATELYEVHITITTKKIESNYKGTELCFDCAKKIVLEALNAER